MEEQMRQALLELEEAKRAVEELKAKRDTASKQVEQAKRTSKRYCRRCFLFQLIDKLYCFSRDSAAEQQYADTTFWDRKYASRNESFEWYVSFEDVKGMVVEEVHQLSKVGVSKVKVLLPGCGDSNFGEEMVQHGTPLLTLCIHFI